MNYYERHLGDYARATLHLSLLEHGVYSILLDRYYSTEQPIPAGQVYRVALARTRAEKRAVDAVLQEFFYLQDGAWHHRRCDEEIGAARARMEAARANGAKGGRPRKEGAATSESQVRADENPSETQSKAKQKPTKTQAKPKQNPIESSPITNHQSPITSHCSVADATAVATAGVAVAGEGVADGLDAAGKTQAKPKAKAGAKPGESQAKANRNPDESALAEAAPAAAALAAPRLAVAGPPDGEPLVAGLPDAGPQVVALSRAQVWQAALSLLGAQGMPQAQARAFVGSLARDLGGNSGALEEVVRGAVAEQPADARAWLKAACLRRNGTRGTGRRAGQHNGLLALDHWTGVSAEGAFV